MQNKVSQLILILLCAAPLALAGCQSHEHPGEGAAGSGSSDEHPGDSGSSEHPGDSGGSDEHPGGSGSS